MEIFLNAWIEREDGELLFWKFAVFSIDRSIPTKIDILHAKYSNVHAPPVKG